MKSRGLVIALAILGGLAVVVIGVVLWGMGVYNSFV